MGAVRAPDEVHLGNAYSYGTGMCEIQRVRFLDKRCPVIRCSEV